MAVGSAELAAVSPREQLEQRYRDAARRLRRRRSLGQSRCHDEVQVRARRRQAIGRWQVERQCEISQMKSQLDAKQAEFSMFLDTAASEAGQAHQAAAACNRERSIEKEKCKHHDDRQRALEAKRAADALKHYREPRLAKSCEAEARQALHVQVKHSEEQRAKEASMHGRSLALRRQAIMQEDLVAKRLANRRPRFIPKSDFDRRSGSDYVRNRSHVVHHDRCGGDLVVDAVLDRELSQPPKPSTLQNERADARGRAAKAELILERLDQSLEYRMEFEESQSRLAKIRRATSAGALPGSTCARWAREVPPTSAAALAEAEAILAQAMPRPPQTSCFDEWTNKVSTRKSPTPGAAALRHGVGRWQRASHTVRLPQVQSIANHHGESLETDGRRPFSAHFAGGTVATPRHGGLFGTNDTLGEHSPRPDRLRRSRSLPADTRCYTFYDDCGSFRGDSEDPPPSPPPPWQLPGIDLQTSGAPATPREGHWISSDTRMQPCPGQSVHVSTSQVGCVQNNNEIIDHDTLLKTSSTVNDHLSKCPQHAGIAPLSRAAMVQNETPESKSYVSGIRGTRPSFADTPKDENEANTSTDRMTALLAEAEALLRETAEAAAPFFGGMAAWAIDGPSDTQLGNYPSSAGHTDPAPHYSEEQVNPQPGSQSQHSFGRVSFQLQQRVATTTDQPVARRWGSRDLCRSTTERFCGSTGTAL
eukprot:CAMPEP_0172861470 /NCGR_PEP_ID=MMETSP1075-20121228/72678_1 /TAXON_ID=2916 /ORGANISM="Ceratium fusus, Strain PA161109" /LENGTH=704 /DNA_ID=CAMNT_0013709609 /DNA_START=99 /DNA_END=2213 /DNA_ORIENTATION=-